MARRRTRRLTPAQIRAGFGGKAMQSRARSRSRRTMPTRARRVYSTARRAGSATRRVYRRARSSRVGQRFHFATMANGAMTNVAQRVGHQYLGPKWGPAAGALAVGVIRDDDVAQWMAGYMLGGAVSLGDFGASTPAGGYW